MTSVKHLAAFVHAEPWELVLVPNATTALCAVILSLSLSPMDIIFTLNVGYGSVKVMADSACTAAMNGARVVEANFDPEAIKSEEEVRLTLLEHLEIFHCTQQVLAFVEANFPVGTRLAIFDHITSNTAIMFPVKLLVELARKRGALGDCIPFTCFHQFRSDPPRFFSCTQPLFSNKR